MTDEPKHEGEISYHFGEPAHESSEVRLGKWLIPVLISAVVAIVTFMMTQESRLTRGESNDLIHSSAILQLQTQVNGPLAELLRNFDERMTRIESTRYTAADGIKDREAIRSELNVGLLDVRSSIQKLESGLDALRAKIPDKIPPEWFLNRVYKLEDDLKALTSEVSKISAKVDVIQHTTSTEKKQ